MFYNNKRIILRFKIFIENSVKSIFYLINKNETILYTRKNLINNTNYFILIKHFKNIKKLFILYL